MGFFVWLVACFSFLCCLVGFLFGFLFLFLKLKYFALALNLQIGFGPAYPLVILLWQVTLIKCPKHEASGALWTNLCIFFTPSVLCNVNAKVCHATCAVLLDINTLVLPYQLLGCASDDSREDLSPEMSFSVAKRKDWNVASRVLKARCYSHEKGLADNLDMRWIWFRCQ